MSFAHRELREWKLKGRSLETGKRTLVMGVVNVTPDSFSDGGLFSRPEEAVSFALRMLSDGADILDIGGESTRPGKHEPVSVEEEIARVLPVIEGVLKQRPDAVISIDTYKAETAKAAIRAGAEIVNDVSGFLWDPEIAEVCLQLECGVVLMHSRGRPEDWRTLPSLRPEEVVGLVKRELEQRLTAATAAAIAPERVMLDPGIGFGKAYESNYPLLAGLEELRSLGRPLLSGVSRKSFLGRTVAKLRGGTEVPPAERGTATLAAITASILAGADAIRVHEVRSAVEAAAIADAVLAV